MALTRLANGTVDQVRPVDPAGRPAGRHRAGPPARPHRGQARAAAAGGRGAAGPSGAPPGRRTRPPDAPARRPRPAPPSTATRTAAAAVSAARSAGRRPRRSGPTGRRRPVPSRCGRSARLPMALLRTANIILTTEDAVIGATPRDVVWTHRKTTLYRYRCTKRTAPGPVLLVFALINRPDIFDLRPGNSFVEFLLDEGYDVFLLDWGVPGEEDADLGLGDYVCDELHVGGARDACAPGQERGDACSAGASAATLSAMHTALDPDGAGAQPRRCSPCRSTPGSLYASWVGRDSFDVDASRRRTAPCPAGPSTSPTSCMKPVTNYWTTQPRSVEQVSTAGTATEAYQAMAKWVADNPPFPAPPTASGSRGCTRRTASSWAPCACAAGCVDFGRISARTCSWSRPAPTTSPRARAPLPLLDMVGGRRHPPRPPRRAHRPDGRLQGPQEIWPDIADWLAERSNRLTTLTVRRHDTVRSRPSGASGRASRTPRPTRPHGEESTMTTSQPLDSPATDVRASRRRDKLAGASPWSPAARAASAPPSRAASPPRAPRSPPATAATTRPPTPSPTTPRQAPRRRRAAHHPPGQHRLRRRLPPRRRTRSSSSTAAWTSSSTTPASPSTASSPR